MVRKRPRGQSCSVVVVRTESHVCLNSRWAPVCARAEPGGGGNDGKVLLVGGNVIHLLLLVVVPLFCTFSTQDDAWSARCAAANPRKVVGAAR